MTLDFEPCDQCRARSYVFIELNNGHELSYCGSHYTTHQIKLTELGAHILDLRYLITT